MTQTRHMHRHLSEWLTAFGSAMLTSKATLFETNLKGLPQTCPSVCLRLPFADMPTGVTRLLSTELPTVVEPENFNSHLK